MRFTARALFILAACALAAPAAAQHPRAAASSSSDSTAIVRTLVGYENGWANALVRRDTAYFERMLAAGFVYTEDASVMSRRDVLQGAIAPDDTVTASHNEQMVVHVASPTVAVVTGILVVQGRSAGKPYLHRYRFTDTWVKRGGRWQIVAAQDYLMPGARGS